MVKRDSKYKTNKTVSKHIAAEVNTYIHEKARHEMDSAHKHLGRLGIS